MFHRVSFRRVRALCKKESLQIFRDPSSILIAFVLPVVLLFIFGYGINLDSAAIRMGLVLEESSEAARSFADSFIGSPYLRVETGSRPEMEQALTDGRIRGLVVIPGDFSAKLAAHTSIAPVQFIGDGAEPNLALFAENYARGAWENWLQQRSARAGADPSGGIALESRFWFNPSALSRHCLIPGSITIIMTVIGALLTSLVVAREWERGTMEAILASPATRLEILLSKILPYYALGMGSLLVCVATAVFILGVPFRGSIPMLWAVASFFLLSALGMGLLFSTLTRNQFNAAQAALNAAFLPAMMLSGYIYEIKSAPPAVQAITYLVPARYFVAALQTLFLAGDVGPLLWKNLLFLALAALLFLGWTWRKTRPRLD